MMDKRVVAGLALTLLFILTAGNNLVYSSLQQEHTINSSGTINYDFSEHIIFEHGGETGKIVPPWDAIQIRGGADGSVTLQSSIVRSGDYALRFYLNADNPPDTARAEVVNWNLGYKSLKDLYFSYWVYLPNDYRVDDWDALFDNKYIVYGSPSVFYDLRKAILRSTGPGGAPQVWVEWTDGVWRNSGVSFPRGEWVHCQQHFKIGTSDGQRQIWINNVLIYEETNANTALTRQEVTATNIGTIEFKNYVGAGETSIIIKYLDDYVVATEKVPAYYRVIGK